MFTRQLMIEFRSYLLELGNPADVHAALLARLDRALDHEDEQPLDPDKATLLDRAFNAGFEIEPLPPRAYTAVELLEIVRTAASIVRRRPTDEDEELSAAFYEEEAFRYDAMAASLERSDIKEAMALHARMDTYTRGYVEEVAGFDYGRFAATRKEYLA